jgi:hypothetical protein
MDLRWSTESLFVERPLLSCLYAIRKLARFVDHLHGAPPSCAAGQQEGDEKDHQSAGDNQHQRERKKRRHDNSLMPTQAKESPAHGGAGARRQFIPWGRICAWCRPVRVTLNVPEGSEEGGYGGDPQALRVS